MQHDSSAISPPPDVGAIHRIPAIDGLRGVAISLVIALHFGVAAEFPRRSGMAWLDWLERAFYVGWSGVDLFLVLSGFLITSILLASRDHPLYFRNFYARRALRILPLYYTGVVLVYVVAPLAWPGALRALDQGTSGQVWLWTYTLNIALVFGWAGSMGLLGHFWTLAIEEQYYVFWPFAVKWGSPRVLLAICGSLVVAALVLRIGWVALGFSWEGAYRFTLARFDALAIGGLVAALAREPRMRTRLIAIGPYVLTLSGAALTALFFYVPRFYPSEPVVVTAGHSLLAVFSAALVTFAIRDRVPQWMLNPALRVLGTYSYSIYVWHWPIQRVLVTWYPDTDSTGLTGAGAAMGFLTLGITLSCLVGWGSYHLIEQPFLRLKSAFGYRRSRHE